MRSEFEQFVEKVAAENPDRVIDHSCWESCAIGDFASEDVRIEEMLTDFQSIHDSYLPKHWKDLISDLYNKYGIEE